MEQLKQVLKEKIADITELRNTVVVLQQDAARKDATIKQLGDEKAAILADKVQLQAQVKKMKYVTFTNFYIFI